MPLLRCSTSAEAIERLLAGEADVLAGVRQPLRGFADRNREYDVLADSFMEIRQAVGVPRGRSAAARVVATFVEEMKRSGAIAAALAAGGRAELTVAASDEGMSA